MQGKLGSSERCGERIRAALLLTACALAPQMAWAQESEPAERSGGLEEIVVTAQKREQSIQDVPVAITAFSQEALQANRITSVQDLSGLAPNTVIREIIGGNRQPSVSMRGIQATAGAPGADKEVSIYLDGVYLGAARGTLFELPDVARIEVLRGPQGTLFGRNATAGAVSIVTRDPTGELGFTQSFSYGNLDQFRSRTTLDLPSWGPLSAYISFVHSERDGAVRNTGAGTCWDRSGPGTGVGIQCSPDTLGASNNESLFAAVKLELSDDFRVTYKFDRSVDEYTPGAVGLVVLNDDPATGGLAGAVIASVLNNQAEPFQYVTDAKRPDALNNWWTTRPKLRGQGHNITIDIGLADNLSIKNVAAYRKSSLNNSALELLGIGGVYVTPEAATANPISDALLAPHVGERFVGIGSSQQSRSSQWSNELQVNFDSDIVTLTAGGIWFKQKDRTGPPPYSRGTASLAFFPITGEVPLGNTGVSVNRAESIAGYLNAEFHVTPSLDLVAGGRVTHDKKSGTFVNGGSFSSTVPGCPPGDTNPSGICRTEGDYVGLNVSEFSYRNTEPSYSFGVNYKANPDVLIYGKYSKSFVSGGSVGGVTWEPEGAKSWEAGAKADFLNRRLRTNLALFHVTYTHVQSAQSGRNVGRPDLGSVIVSAGTVKAKGFELEVTALPVDGITLGGSLGYTDTKASNVNPLLLGLLGNFEYSAVPKWTSSLYAQYESEPVMGNARVFLRADANWRSRIRFDTDPDRADLLPAFKITEFGPARWLINGRAALKDIELGSYTAEIAAWGRNLTNNRDMAYPMPVAFGVGATFEDARTFGLDFTISY